MSRAWGLDFVSVTMTSLSIKVRPPQTAWLRITIMHLTYFHPPAYYQIAQNHFEPCMVVNRIKLSCQTRLPLTS